MSAELDALQYLLGLDGLGLGGKAGGIYGRWQVSTLRPLLMAQERALQASIDRSAMHRAGPVAELGERPICLCSDCAAAGAKADAEAQKLEQQIETAWLGLLDHLKTLWLTEGQALADP